MRLRQQSISIASFLQVILQDAVAVELNVCCLVQTDVMLPLAVIFSDLSLTLAEMTESLEVSNTRTLAPWTAMGDSEQSASCGNAGGVVARGLVPEDELMGQSSP